MRKPSIRMVRNLKFHQKKKPKLISSGMTKDPIKVNSSIKVMLSRRLKTIKNWLLVKCRINIWRGASERRKRLKTSSICSHPSTKISLEIRKFIIRSRIMFRKIFQSSQRWGLTKKILIALFGLINKTKTKKKPYVLKPSFKLLLAKISTYRILTMYPSDSILLL